jgi:hypothetical protein
MAGRLHPGEADEIVAPPKTHALLLDQLAGAGEQRERNGQTKRLRALQIDDQ